MFAWEKVGLGFFDLAERMTQQSDIPYAKLNRPFHLQVLKNDKLQRNLTARILTAQWGIESLHRMIQPLEAGSENIVAAQRLFSCAAASQHMQC